MDVAISGDRACCLTQELGPDTYLFAVANGFGTVEGQPIAPAVLARLRGEFERRARGDRLRRAEHRAKGITSSLLSAFARVNEDLHARTASHEDYVTAGCSVTGVLLVQERAYLAHVGSTAAYLARDGYVVSLTKNDAFEDEGVPVLMRALVCAPTVEVAICNFSLSEGDALVLAGRRLREPQSIAHSTQKTASGDQLLVVRYARPPQPEVPEQAESHTFATVLTGVLATVFFYALLCLK
jgi:serine/threonine protein phosphatase PrpC